MLPQNVAYRYRAYSGPMSSIFLGKGANLLDKMHLICCDTFSKDIICVDIVKNGSYENTCC